MKVFGYVFGADFYPVDSPSLSTDMLEKATPVYKEADQWISAEDRLPEIGIPVLVWEGGDDANVSYFTGEYEKPRLKKNPIWNDYTGYYSPKGITGIKAWAILPSPPTNK